MSKRPMLFSLWDPAGGQGKEVQMCESPRVMRQPWLWTTWPTLGAGHKFSSVYCCTGWCTGGFVIVCFCVQQSSHVWDIIDWSLRAQRIFSCVALPVRLDISGCIWVRCINQVWRQKVSSSAGNTVRWVSTHLTILSLLYLMNYSAQDAIREGDCFLSAISTEYTV